MTNLERRLVRIEAKLTPVAPEEIEIRIITAATGQVVSRMVLTVDGFGRATEVLREGEFFRRP